MEDVRRLLPCGTKDRRERFDELDRSDAVASIWEVYDERRPLLGALYGGGLARMVAFGLEGGGLAVVSPGPGSGDARGELVRFGRVRTLLAPNHFHNQGLDEWTRAFPEAEIVAHPRAHARLATKVRPATRIAGLDALTSALPEGVRLLSPPGAKQGETWVALDLGNLRALVVCDAITNMKKTTWVTYVLGFRARLMTNPFWKRVSLSDKRAYKAWLLEEIRANPPNLFIPAHGDVLRGDDVASELERITSIA